MKRKEMEYDQDQDDFTQTMLNKLICIEHELVSLIEKIDMVIECFRNVKGICSLFYYLVIKSRIWNH